jgi:hypothetical protein
VFRSFEARGSEVLKWMFTVFEVECSQSLKWDVQRSWNGMFKDGQEVSLKVTPSPDPPAGKMAALAAVSRASGAKRRATHP